MPPDIDYAIMSICRVQETYFVRTKYWAAFIARIPHVFSCPSWGFAPYPRIKKALPRCLYEIKERSMKDQRVYVRVSSQQLARLKKIAAATQLSTSKLMLKCLESDQFNPSTLRKTQKAISDLLDEIAEILEKLRKSGLGENPVIDDLYIDFATLQGRLNKLNLDLISSLR
ncbi:hypothetical protein HMPREF3232_00492 [Fannyhessea vaginae]|nr:hypothetical protein HMPREF3232_00492 [Fannyhessea vaginae]